MSSITMSFCCRWWKVLLQSMLIWHLHVKTLMNFIGLNLVGTSYKHEKFLWKLSSKSLSLLLAIARARDIWTRRQRVAPRTQLHSECGDNHIIQPHTSQPPRLCCHETPPCNKNRIKLRHRQTDTQLARNLSFSYLSIQTLIVLCPYWITGKLSLNLERKISFHSDDNYQFPILFNLYKMWNLLIWVKLLRQRNTPHVLFCSTPTWHCYCGPAAISSFEDNFNSWLLFKVWIRLFVR